MQRLVLVHGSVTNGVTTWSAQAPLAERFRLLVLERPGFPPGPPVERSTSRSTQSGSRSASSPATISPAIPTAA